MMVVGDDFYLGSQTQVSPCGITVNKGAQEKCYGDSIVCCENVKLMPD
ncbi:hypothetical protein L798_08076 [Zootermopsis nevadensis]|uniref:Uncharacterized protein n=1 Tax=Zootermopsis nevadensis TaxID=136037 RepID=A0A067RDF8_ZOONE|nr:hypothetical protein L798_08076 [Zootermopsis nevadensis]